MDLFRLQDLPVELQRSILEVTARMDLKTALNLSLVCHQLHEWIQPLIYEMVTLGRGDVALFLRTMAMFPADFFVRYVKRLCLTVSVRPHDARTILQTCTGVSNLACWVDFMGISPASPFRHLFYPLPLRRLSIEVGHFRQLGFSECVWTGSLTCLDIVFWDQGPLVLSELRFLPSLARLSLYLSQSDVDEPSLLSILSATPTLQILVLVVEEDDLDRFEHTTRIDPRIVCMPHPPTVPDWEAPHRGLPDLWSHAEEIVDERRRAANQMQTQE
ncbi:hypothetical protein D9757_005926 [Collybiopsis confluens]|uniref:F-box domain-containing protein n=1 Tax=Collybiopsis confluens TaxID=2823264 RepID=A0A8H5HNP6_9AGAR|nr:hypothetical protein D9757_005926 [Collybiopsis confluens]